MRAISLLTVALLALIPIVPAAAGDEPAADPVERAMENPPATGLLITKVVPGSQAADLALEPGQVIVAYGGAVTPDVARLREAMAGAAEKPSVTMEVVGIDGTKHTLTAAPGPIGVQLTPVTKGKPVPPLPPATEVVFDFSSLAGRPHDDWYAFGMAGEGHCGFEHAIVKLEEGKLVMRREVAFDGGERWGVNHFVVSAVVTAEATPRLVSLSFENPVNGYVGEGKVEILEDGTLDWRFSWRTTGDESGEARRDLPQDLPAVPSYFVETLARFMPRQEGACLHFHPVMDSTGELGRPAALFVVGEEEVEVGGSTVKAWRIEQRHVGGSTSTTFWVNEHGHVVRGDYGGPVTTAASREDALKDLHPEIEPRTAN